MIKRITLTVLTILALFSTLNAFAKEGTKLFVFPAHSVKVEKPVKGDVLVVGKDVEILAQVEGNVSVIGGSIRVKGDVKGNCVSIGGGVYVKGGKIEGETVSIGELFGKNKLYLLLLNSFFWIISIGLGLYFYGENIKENAFEFADDFIRLFFFGFYSLVALSILSLISFALIKVGIGFILFLAVFVVVFGIYVFSILTLFYFFGDFISKLLKVNFADSLKMFLGLVVYQSLKFIPLLGFIAFIILLSASFGATLYSRFGTFKSWFGLPRFWGE